MRRSNFFFKYFFCFIAHIARNWGHPEWHVGKKGQVEGREGQNGSSWRWGVQELLRGDRGRQHQVGCFPVILFWSSGAVIKSWIRLFFVPNCGIIWRPFLELLLFVNNIQQYHCHLALIVIFIFIIYLILLLSNSDNMKRENYRCRKREHRRGWNLKTKRWDSSTRLSSKSPGTQNVRNKVIFVSWDAFETLIYAFVAFEIITLIKSLLNLNHCSECGQVGRCSERWWEGVREAEKRRRETNEGRLFLLN